MAEPATDNVTSILEERERRIEAAERNGYLVRGRELGAIQAEGSWRERYNYATFEEYCEQRWELKHSRVYQLINAAALAEKFHNCGLPLPSRESHIRPLHDRLTTNDGRLAVWNDTVKQANGDRIKTSDVEAAIERWIAKEYKAYVTVDDWQLLDETERRLILDQVGKKGLNKQDNQDIEWADWSWNPITGCLHGCPYCYARDIAFNIYPKEVGFAPALWGERLTAPRNQTVPIEAETDIRRKNIFTCSMADLFGRWVPDEWISRVLQEVSDNPQWNFLFLTKFPKRMAEFEIPANAWMGTSIDLQARVANAERAFAKVKAPIRWLSIEPMLEPLKFEHLDLFHWVVIGGASPSKAIDDSPATPAWSVPIDWIADMHRQAREAGCKIYYKTNSGLTGATRLREFPGGPTSDVATAPEVFDYLRAIPRDEQTG